MTQELAKAPKKQLKPISQCSIEELVKVRPRDLFVKSGGTDEEFIREAGFAMQLMNNNDYLQKMDKQSIVDACIGKGYYGS